MQISDSKFQYIFNMYKDENKTPQMKKEIHEARKENPSLDRALYAMDLAELYKDMAKSKQIAHKIAKGEKVTEEEKKYLAEYDAEMLRKAESAREKSKELKDKIKNLSKEEAQSIIMSLAVEASGLIKSGDTEYGELLMEGVREVTKKVNRSDDKESISKYNKRFQDRSKFINSKI